MDGEVPGLLSELEATFQGSIEFEESLAATDLALSMRRDQKLYERVLRWRGARLVDGPPHPVSAVAPDHVVLGHPPRCFVRVEAVALMPWKGEETPIRRSEDPLSVALRTWVRAGERVEVRLLSGSVVGLLTEVTPDHILVEGSASAAIPYQGIRWISLCPGG